MSRFAANLSMMYTEHAFLLELLDELGYDEWIGCKYRPGTGTSAGLGWARKWLGK